MMGFVPRGSVAQSVEQRPFKALVVGSSPTRPTIAWICKRAWHWIVAGGPLLLAAFVASSCAVAQSPAPAQGAPTGLLGDVVFTEYTPLAGAAEIVRRLMSPLNGLRVSRAIQGSGTTVRDQVIDLSHEKFAVYVPAREPPDGYSLLVFVPPWPQAEVPRKWISTLDRHGMIFVSAANSGNEADTLDRRDPLALLAAHNILRRYRIAPGRVYIGGFSGGARIAERVALGFPDVFRGVLLDAGSDPIGSAEVPLPPSELLRTFQESTRVVYLTGGRDEPHLQMDTVSRQSLTSWCVFDIAILDMPWVAHELADAGAFNNALRALEDRKDVPGQKLETCRARVARDMTQELDEVERLHSAGKAADARALLRKLDAHYGGLAGPRSIQLAEQLAEP
jgi:pimeloyl-ACP methyl ester carboxylesterase